jgi:recombination protein RecA
MKDNELCRIGDNKSDIEVLSTGSISLDNALGVGGLPRGRIVEIYGPEASGKTTITLVTIAKCQADGGRCAFIDAEHALSPKLATGCGVDWDNLLFAQPNSGEQALDVVCKLAASGKVDVIVVDSVAALTPQAELDGDMDSVQMGAQARMLGKGIRKIKGFVHKSNCVVIFINQLREKLGVMFGNPETTPGGKALKFFASVRLDVRRRESITKNKKIIGNSLKVKVVKNKVAIPHEVAEFDLYFGKGIDNTKDIITIGVGLNVITKKGSGYYQYDNDVKANGLDNFIDKMDEFNKRDEIESKIYEAMKVNPVVRIESEEDGDDDDGFDDDD